MKNKSCLVFCLFVGILLTACESDIELGNSQQTSNAPVESELTDSKNNDQPDSSSESALPQINLHPIIEEQFYAYPLTSSGTLYASIDKASYYTNVFEAKVDSDCFLYEVANAQMDTRSRFFDPKTGDVLPEYIIDDENPENILFTVPRVFLLAQVTMSNIDAISQVFPYEKTLRAVDPLFADGYCEKYDFPIELFRFNTERNEKIGRAPEYFTLNHQAYPEGDPRDHFLRLAPGETISFEIGAFMDATIVYDDQAKYWGGAIGDNLIPRFVINTGAPSEPTIHLGLK